MGWARTRWHPIQNCGSRLAPTLGFCVASECGLQPHHILSLQALLPFHDRVLDLLAMTPHGWRANAERRASVIEQAEPFEVTVSMRYDYFVLQ